MVKASSDKRESILEAALSVMVEKGYYGATIPEIAKAAGVATGTIYVHFQDKHALVNDLYRHWKMAKRQALAKADPAGTPRDGFFAMVRAYLEFGLENPRGLAFLESHYHVSYLDEANQRLNETFVQGILDYVQAMIDAKVFRKAHPRVLLSVIHGVAVGLLTQIWSGELEPEREHIEQAIQACWEGVRA